MKFGSPNFRRNLLKWLPYGTAQRLQRIVDVMDNTSNSIYAQKKDALAKGDEAVVRQVGQGKDIISVLCEFST